MNESEKRRQQLLNETRNLYSDKRIPPAVHPRHHAIYGALYSDATESELQTSTMSLRIIVCILLFLCFVGMDYQKMSFRNMNTQELCSEITNEVDIMEVWNNL